jgi:hypothetical protein
MYILEPLPIECRVGIKYRRGVADPVTVLGAVHRLVSVAERAIHVQEKTRANLSLLTELSGPTLSIVPTRNRRLTRTSTLNNANASGLTWSPITMNGEKEGTIGWTSQPDLSQTLEPREGEGGGSLIRTISE